MANAFKARARNAVRPMALFTGAVVTLAAAAVGLHLAKANWKRQLASSCPPAAAAAPAAPAEPTPATLEQERDDSFVDDGDDDDDTDAEQVVGVAASTTADVVVVWSTRSICTLDGSKRLLDGDADVAAVAVGPDGTVFAVRAAGALGVSRPGAEDQWRPAPISDLPEELQAPRPGWVAVVEHAPSRSHAFVALTRDRGETWAVERIPGEEVESPIVHVGAGGEVDVLLQIPDCMSSELARYQSRIGSHRWRAVEIEDKPPWSEGFGHDGTAYTMMTVAGRAQTYTLVAGDEAEPRLAMLQGGRRIDVDLEVPKDLELKTVDRLGRPLGVANGSVWRWSRTGRWERLKRPVGACDRTATPE